MSGPGERFFKGALVAGYRLRERVGRGGFSEVWRATRDAPGGGDVALKLLLHPEHVRQIRAEADALTLVRGRGIVLVVDVDLHGDPPFIALELLDRDLRRELHDSGGKLEPTEAVGVVERLLEVLARTHAEGVVHGDLKPENVLFARAGEIDDIRLADFGLSRRIAQGTATLSASLSREDARLAGTLEYMAPEQRAGQRPTPRSDVFAMGVILYEVLTGERPQGVFAFPSDRDPRVPPVIDRLLACSLAVDPRHRFATAGAMLAFLRQGLSEDWKELVEARDRTVYLLEAPRARHVNGCLVLLAGLVLLALMLIQTASVTMPEWLPVLHRLLVLALGTSLALLLVRPWVARRERRLEAMLAKLEQQIRSEKAWKRDSVSASPPSVPSR